MRRVATLLLLLGSMGVACAPLTERSFRYDLALDIDVSGRVVRVTLPDGVPAPFVVPLEKAASGWIFKAPVRDGMPVKARTYARVKLLLVPQDKEHYAMRITVLSNGPSLAFTHNPLFPPEMMRARTEGTVYMSAVVQPDGRVTDIELEKADLSQHSVVNTPRAARLFAEAAREAMQTMQARPEWVGGHPVATSIVLPMSFSLNGTTGADGSASGSAVGR